MKMNNASFTFWQAIKQYEIAIPDIQRDYIQGRDSKVVQSALDGLLNEMNTAIQEGSLVNLNFVYGKVDGNLFLPLDGQQRLTTLFLLHWYALLRRKENDKEAFLNTLSKFSYHARSSSKDYFLRITELEYFSEIAEDLANTSDTRISQLIWDSSWFRAEWKFDPTIKSTWVVLDKIHEIFSESSDKLWQILTNQDDCPIRFEWLNVENIGNEDDLYIKMNARGKMLSAYENFKADLEKRATSILDEADFANFFMKLDQRWADFFWNYRSASGYDKAMLNFFRWMLWNKWSELNSYTGTIRGDEDGVRTLQSSMVISTLEEFDTSLENGKSVFTKETFKQIEGILDYVTSENASSEIIGIVLACADEEGKSSYADRAMLEVASTYLQGVAGVFDDDSWGSWYRVFRNLSASSERYQGYNVLGLFSNAIKCIVSLRDRATDILHAFADEKVKISGFAPEEQITEERIKANLLLNRAGLNWEDSIFKAEALPYFSGKVGFLLRFAGVCSIVDAAASTSVELDCFKKYLSLIGEIFSDTGFAADEILLRRALLSKGDYSIKLKSLKSYVVSDDRDIDWRAYFRLGHQDVNVLFRELLDDLATKSGNINSKLKAIVDTYVWDQSRDDFWAKYLIDSDDLFGKLGTIFQFKIEESLWSTPLCFFPIRSNTVASGNNKELNNMLIAEAMKNKGWDVRFLYLKGTQPGSQYELKKNGLTFEIGLNDWGSKEPLLLLEMDATGISKTVVITDEYLDIIQYLNSKA